MLEGLEISEIRLSGLERTRRMDAQFYSRENLLATKRLDALQAKPVTDFASVSDGNHMGVSDKFVDDADGVPYYRGSDIYNLFIEQSSAPMRIDRGTFLSPQMARSRLRKGDVLMSIVGAIIGNLSLVSKNVEAACSCKLAILRPYAIRAELLSVFLSSYFGQIQVQKFKRGAAQTGLILEDFDQLKIPAFSKKFETVIVSVVSASFETTETAKKKFAEAEDLLLNIFDMKQFLPSTEGINIKSFKDSFARTERLDAEYYQPKYEQWVSHITARPHARLADLVSIKKSIEPGSEAYTDDEDGLPFLRVADYSKLGLSTPQKRLTTAFVADNKKKLASLKPKKNTILFSKDGSVGEAFCLREDANFITSGAILHLNVKEGQTILPDYLALALNSTLVRTQAERDAGGSIILHWRVGEIENVIVPLVDADIQQKIATLVQQSFTLKAQSERLLEAAKRAVEIAIEQDEAAGMAYLAREGVLT